MERSPKDIERSAQCPSCGHALDLPPPPVQPAAKRALGRLGVKAEMTATEEPAAAPISSRLDRSRRASLAGVAKTAVDESVRRELEDAINAGYERKARRMKKLKFGNKGQNAGKSYGVKI